MAGHVHGHVNWHVKVVFERYWFHTVVIHAAKCYVRLRSEHIKEQWVTQCGRGQWEGVEGGNARTSLSHWIRLLGETEWQNMQRGNILYREQNNYLIFVLIKRHLGSPVIPTKEPVFHEHWHVVKNKVFWHVYIPDFDAEETYNSTCNYCIRRSAPSHYIELKPSWYNNCWPLAPKQTNCPDHTLISCQTFFICCS